MRARFGTSGFSYPEWRGTFYPEKLAASEMLSFYANRLPTVELNNSFYRMPRLDVVSTWKRSVPTEFRFAMKAPRRITHIKKLKGVAEFTRALFGALEAFEQTLGPTLFQLPPFLKRDVGLLSEFLRALPSPHRVAVEFRNSSWFEETTYQVLSDHAAALVAGDLDDSDRSPPLVRTCSFAYLRLRRTQYLPADLDGWAQRLTTAGFDVVYGYFKHETLGPSLAEAMNQRLSSEG